MQKKLFILFFCLFVIVLFAETVFLINGETISGKIIGFKSQKVYLDYEKELYIISYSMISKVVDDNNSVIAISDIPELDHYQLKFNSFTKFIEIKPEKPPKLFTPRYSSKRFGEYYDHRTNRMLFGLTARALEKNILSITNYDVALMNYSIGLFHNTEFEMFMSPFFMSEIFGISVKYQVYSHPLLAISLRSGYRFFGDPLHDEGFKDKCYDMPNSLLLTFGSVDHQISANIDVNPTIDHNYESIDRFITFTYHIGGSLRLFKHMKIYFEIFNSWPLADEEDFSYSHFTWASGIRFFWKKNSLDLGLLDYGYNRGSMSDTMYPIVSYTHHFYTK